MNTMAASDAFDDVSFLSLSTLLRVSRGPQEFEKRHDFEDADSSDSETWSPGSGTDMGVASESSVLSQKERQLTKFLDHIAETFAREKCVPLSQAKRYERRNSSKHGRGASHVAAAGLIRTDRESIIYIAKNGGVDGVDEDLAKSLATWMKAIAITTKRPTIDKDIMWGLLVTYYKQRLDIYAAQIGCLSESDLTIAFQDGSDKDDLAQVLLDLSARYQAEASVETLKQMVTIAYKLRYEPEPEELSVQSRKVRRCVCFLGRLRSAYEVFKETAIEFRRSFTKLKIICLQAPEAVRISKTLCEKGIEELARDNGVPIPKRKRIQAELGEGSQVFTHCHAEVQILIHFECLNLANTNPFPYIGCSKRSCWLCFQLLSIYRAKRSGKRGFYETRGCHGQIYPRWHATPSTRPSDPHVQFYLTTTIREIQDLMVQRLREVYPSQRLAVAESSVNATVVNKPLQRRALAKQRIAESTGGRKNKESRQKILRDFVCSTKCLRIPACSELPHLFDVRFYRYPVDYSGCEPSNYCIPDFSTYWGISNFERAFRRITVTGQDQPEVNGEYHMYWCRNRNLPPNQNLMSLLRIDILELEDYFWCGDVFITRFHENEKSFAFYCEDVPRTFLDSDRLRMLARAFWDSREPEHDIKSLQHFNSRAEKMTADKEILLNRM